MQVKQQPRDVNLLLTLTPYTSHVIGTRYPHRDMLASHRTSTLTCSDTHTTSHTPQPSQEARQPRQCIKTCAVTQCEGGRGAVGLCDVVGRLRITIMIRAANICRQQANTEHSSVDLDWKRETRKIARTERKRPQTQRQTPSTFSNQARISHPVT